MLSKGNEATFFGAFIKDKNIRFKDREEESVSAYQEGKYLKVASDIIEVLGEKEIYSAYEAARYFIEKYQCIQIPLYCEIAYRDTLTPIVGMFNSFDSNKAEIYDEHWDYSEIRREGKEQIITLLFDYYNNKKLSDLYESVRNMYSEVMTLKERKLKANESDYVQFNNILVIGSYDGFTINSMSLIDDYAVIEDIEYEIYFFSKRS